MTKAELIQKMGNEDRANWVMEQLLRSVKPAFIETMLKSLAKEFDELVKLRETSGYYMDGVVFPEEFNYFSYQIAVDEGNDDGSKAAMLRKYNLWDNRQLEKVGDRRTQNFYHNMLTEFCSH